MTDQGDRLRALRKAAGFLTLAQFARAAGIPEGTARQQAARGSIPVDAAERYIRAAKRTGATVGWLLANDGPGPETVQASPPDPATEKEAQGQFSALLETLPPHKAHAFTEKAAEILIIMADLLTNQDSIYTVKSAPSKEFKAFVARLVKHEEQLVEIQKSLKSMHEGASPEFEQRIEALEHVTEQNRKMIDDLWKDLSNID